MPKPVHADTRGIIAPGRMPHFATLTRFDPPAALVGLIDWFWCVTWDLPHGVTHPQRVLPQPAVNISAGNSPPEGPTPPPGPWPLRVTVDGVATGMTTRSLAGAGFNLAAKTTTGGFGAWVDDVAALTDTVHPAASIIDVSDSTAHNVSDVMPDLTSAVNVLAHALHDSLQRRPTPRIDTAREVARIARIAEYDRSIARVANLATVAGCTPRTLQRLFASHAGVSPTWVIRRFRLLEAADLVAHGDDIDWAAVAADLGYADQSHLVRDFTTNLGVSPAAYARTQR